MNESRADALQRSDVTSSMAPQKSSANDLNHFTTGKKIETRRVGERLLSNNVLNGAIKLFKRTAK